MRVNDLGSPKKLFLVLMAVFALLYYTGRHGTAKPVILHGVVAGLQEQNGVLKALAVDSDGERFVVKMPGFYLKGSSPPDLKVRQEVDLQVTDFKGQKGGVTCVFVALVKAGPVPEGSAPDGDKALPVDDLKDSLGFKGM